MYRSEAALNSYPLPPRSGITPDNFTGLRRNLSIDAVVSKDEPEGRR